MKIDSEVESDIGGKTILNPNPKQELTLDSLIEKITEKNIHIEMDFGPCVGKEISHY